jgi:hypothetical protein
MQSTNPNATLSAHAKRRLNKKLKKQAEESSAQQEVVADAKK